jgi:thiol-disulfide isomerase/thioredoxin
MLRLRTFALFASLALLGAHHRPPTIFDLADAIGKRTPAVTLPTGDGSPLAFADLRGRPTYVFLYASWCGPCKLAFPFVREDFARFGNRVRFVGVDVLDDATAARTAIAGNAFPFSIAIYPIDQLDAQIAPEAQIAAGAKYQIPTDFLLDADGTVRFVWHGLAVNAAGDPIDVLPSYLAKLGIE